MRLTDGQYRDIQSVIDNVRKALAAHGLVFTVEVDFDVWAAFMRAAPGIASVSSTFDPKDSLVGPENAFWIAIRTPDEKIVASGCVRRFVTDDFVELIRNYRLFFDRRPIVEHRPVKIVVPVDAPIIGGNVIYGGGFWVDPEWRGKGLNAAIPKLLRPLSLRHLFLDWMVGLVSDREARRAMAQQGWGSTRVIPCIEGYYPPRDEALSYQLCLTSREECLFGLNRDAEAGVTLASTRPPAEPAVALTS